MPLPPTREQFTAEDELEAFDYVVATRRRQYGSRATDDFRVTGYYGALLNSPRYAAAQLAAAFALRDAGNKPGTYSHADREWVDQVLSHHLRYYGVLGGHIPDAVAVGVRLEAIEALWDGREQDLTDDEQLLTRFIRQYTDGTIDDETWNAMLARLGKRGLVEYVAFIGHLTIVLRMFMALDVPGLPSDKEDVLRVIRGIGDGSIPVPDSKEAVRVG
jgi:hypothetical protein